MIAGICFSGRATGSRKKDREFQRAGVAVTYCTAPDGWKTVRVGELFLLAPLAARLFFQNLIMSLRVSVVWLVMTAGPPLNMCQAAYCSM